jgi:ribosomal protein S18 acetylase RimI-like enzyme
LLHYDRGRNGKEGVSRALSKTAPTIRIEELLITHYDEVVKLWEEEEGVELCEGDSREEVAGYLARNPGLSRIAFDGEKLAGATLCGHDRRRGFIYHLVVSPGYRGCGLGKLLVDACLQGLKTAGIKRAIILVAKDNPGGRAFWSRDGWEEITGALAMAKDVL